jgi:hypothetical protein
MSRHHDKWYTRLFSDPRIVEELLQSFVHESFVKDLDFSSKKLYQKTDTVVRVNFLLSRRRFTGLWPLGLLRAQFH